MRSGTGVLVFTWIVTCIGVAVLQGQQPAFEVASIKPNHTGASPRTYPHLRNGTFTAETASLKTLIVIAYGFLEMRIYSPDWLDTERYDISAKAPEGVPDSEIMPLLQSLLKDRFHLKSHLEMKEIPVYRMLVSKGGAKLTPFDPARPPQVPRNVGQSVTIGVGTTGQIADALARITGRPVVDKTGLEGRFGWTVNFTPFSANANAADSAAPDIFAAVEQQLGLKLESAKESLQIMVVDHVERVPSEN